MKLFECSGGYTDEYEKFSKAVTSKYGMSSEAADREAMYLAKCDNKAAIKAYADMIFYRKIEVNNCYEKAFDLYLRAADISVAEEGELICGGGGIPQAFAMLGYYYYNYKRDGHLKKSEKIAAIEALGEEADIMRLKYSLYLSFSCLKYEKVPTAVNLIGRVFDEVSKSEELFSSLKEDLVFLSGSGEYCDLECPKVAVKTPEDCVAVSEFYYNKAAECGYVYACNSLASKAADEVVKMCLEEIQKGGEKSAITANPPEKIRETIDRYVEYLQMAAKKYEPYAANKLGLFYMVGEVRSGRYDAVFNFRGYCDGAKAKEYFTLATLYPNKNSAWAYYNLLKYFPKDYNMNIELMNEHMDCIKRLDTQVYNLAMEI